MSAEAKNEQKDTFDDAFMAKGDGKFDDDVFSGGGEESEARAADGGGVARSRGPHARTELDDRVER